MVFLNVNLVLMIALESRSIPVVIGEVKNSYISNFKTITSNF